MVSFRVSVPQHALVLNKIIVRPFPHTEQIGKSWSVSVLPRMMTIPHTEQIGKSWSGSVLPRMMSIEREKIERVCILFRAEATKDDIFNKNAQENREITKKKISDFYRLSCYKTSERLEQPISHRD